MRKSSRTCLHTIAPEGYLQWHAWAEEKGKTHEQQQCPACGLWAIWVRKATARNERDRARRRLKREPSSPIS